jgi:hypothetical protein
VEYPDELCNNEVHKEALTMQFILQWYMLHLSMTSNHCLSMCLSVGLSLAMKISKVGHKSSLLHPYQLITHSCPNNSTLYNTTLTPCSKILLKKFPALYGTQTLTTKFTRALHWSVSWARCIHSIRPQPISLISIPILYSHLRLGLPSCLFPSDFPTKTCYKFITSPVRQTCPANLVIFDLITIIISGEAYSLRNSSHIREKIVVK